jgi:hypothetical protein
MGMENKLQVVTASLSAISALLVAAIGIYGSSRLEEIKQETTRVAQAQTIALEREKLRSEQQARLEKNMQELVPKLIGDNENEQRTAEALLFILYPNDAET